MSVERRKTLGLHNKGQNGRAITLIAIFCIRIKDHVFAVKKCGMCEAHHIKSIIFHLLREKELTTRAS